MAHLKRFIDFISAQCDAENAPATSTCPKALLVIFCAVDFKTVAVRNKPLGISFHCDFKRSHSSIWDFNSIHTHALIFNDKQTHIISNGDASHFLSTVVSSFLSFFIVEPNFLTICIIFFVDNNFNLQHVHSFLSIASLRRIA